MREAWGQGHRVAWQDRERGVAWQGPCQDWHASQTLTLPAVLRVGLCLRPQSLREGMAAIDTSPHAIGPLPTHALHHSIHGRRILPPRAGTRLCGRWLDGAHAPREQWADGQANTHARMQPHPQRHALPARGSAESLVPASASRVRTPRRSAPPAAPPGAAGIASPVRRPWSQPPTANARGGFCEIPERMWQRASRKRKEAGNAGHAGE